LSVLWVAWLWVVIATLYRLDGPEVESRWKRDFRCYPDRPQDPNSLLYNGYRVFLMVQRLERAVDLLPVPGCE
jgi:hypothetical protein